MEKIDAKLKPLKIEVLKEMAIKLSADLRDEATIVLDRIMDALMNRMPEDEFVAFCDTL